MLVIDDVEALQDAIDDSLRYGKAVNVVTPELDDAIAWLETNHSVSIHEEERDDEQVHHVTGAGWRLNLYEEDPNEEIEDED